MANNVLDWGFTGLTALASQRVTVAGQQIVDDAIAQSLAGYQAMIDGIVSTFAERTTSAKYRYWHPGSGTLQPLDEWGNPLPVKTGGYTDVGLPIQGGGHAWGDNRITRELMTVGEVARQTALAISMDADWMRRHLLAALFDNVTWTFSDPELGNLSVVPLANGDSQTYPRTGFAPATDNHYLGQAGAIADATNPFPTIRTELLEHPSNAGADVVVYIPTANVSAAQGLANFIDVADANIRTGSGTSVALNPPDPGVGSIIGYTDRVWVAEWDQLPDNYLIGLALGRRPVAMREYPSAALQGLFREPFSPDGNRFEYRFLRYAGFGVQDRTAAVVMEVSDATYDIPAGFDAPLAI